LFFNALRPFTKKKKKTILPRFLDPKGEQIFFSGNPARGTEGPGFFSRGGGAALSRFCGLFKKKKKNPGHVGRGGAHCWGTGYFPTFRFAGKVPKKKFLSPKGQKTSGGGGGGDPPGRGGHPGSRGNPQPATPNPPGIFFPPGGGNKGPRPQKKKPRWAIIFQGGGTGRRGKKREGGPPGEQSRMGARGRTPRGGGQGGQVFFPQARPKKKKQNKSTGRPQPQKICFLVGLPPGLPPMKKVEGKKKHPKKNPIRGKKG